MFTIRRLLTSMSHKVLWGQQWPSYLCYISKTRLLIITVGPFEILKASGWGAQKLVDETLNKVLIKLQ